MTRLPIPEGAAAAAAPPESVWRFSSDGPFPRALRIASNVELELWIDRGDERDLVFVGDGGHRCSETEALAFEYDEVIGSRRVVIKARYLDPSRTECLHRAVFAAAFVDVEGHGDAAWSVARDEQLTFRAPCSNQLPRQCVVGAACSTSEHTPRDDASGGVVAAPIRRALFLEIVPQRIARIAPTTERIPWAPHDADDVGAYARAHAHAVTIDTYELGAIALHRFELDTSRSSAVALVVSEVPHFDDVWATSSRQKVALADAVDAGVAHAAPFGTRGGRYVHVLYDATRDVAPALRAWRREYPLAWRDVDVEPGCEAIVSACRANLIACVDGGLVDTCWRERAQWTGDARMSAIAVRALCDNPEVPALALHQIAQSYDDERAMVQGVAPVHHRKHDLFIPSFHLAFCHAALDDDPSLARDSVLELVVQRSMERWRARYVRDGLVQGIRGWAFTDWDPEDKRHEGIDVDPAVPHAVVNAWWIELCARLGVASGVDAGAFERAFRRDRGYGLLAHDGRASLHASAAIAASGVGDLGHALAHLDATPIDVVRARLTPYFAAFVARAFARRARTDALAFVRAYYGPIAEQYGTLVECTNGDYSRAHGWSVGIADLCLRGT